MRIALTGTPGTGKSTVSRILAGRYRILSVKELAEKHGCAEKEGDELLVDVDCLREKIGCEDCIIEGHLSHLLYPDLIIVLRAHPEVLRKRLEDRNYSHEKLMENLEAEAIDVILEEAMETGRPVYEIDTTEISPEEVAERIERIINGKGEEFRPGRIDFSEVILSWY